MFTGRISTQVAEAAENLLDTWKATIADGRITSCEVKELTQLKQRLVTKASTLDEAVGLTVTMLRRGPESPSLKRRMRERSQHLDVLDQE